MCGICGVIDLRKQNVQPRLLHQMCDLIAHRGPDDAGMVMMRGDQYVEMKANAQSSLEGGFDAGLGHRRLSIIDLSDNAHQPMSNEDGTVWIVFNGEIYNFQEIKPELEGRGHILDRNRIPKSFCMPMKNGESIV